MLDFITKLWTSKNLLSTTWIPFYPYGGIGVFKNFLGIDFSIVYATNTGAAWGMLSHLPKLLLIIRCTFILALLFWVVCWNRDKKKSFPMALILAGAIGNVFDAV
ncbi:signal peptidase II, partial [Chlamydiales bacterium]|nr:signal peptidase II [Chlamydiales bacterium]